MWGGYVRKKAPVRQARGLGISSYLAAQLSVASAVR